MLNYAREWEPNPLKLIRLWQDFHFQNFPALALIMGNLDILELNVSSKKGTFKKVIHKRGMSPASASVSVSVPRADRRMRKSIWGSLREVQGFHRQPVTYANGREMSPSSSDGLECLVCM